MTYGFYLDMTKCIGCKTCQIACKDRNDLDIGVNYREVKSFETGVFPNPGLYHYSAACNHCNDPKCVAGCPTGAMFKAEDGTVQHNDALCIGCKYCVWNCPYGAPQYIEGINIVGKCDSCASEREAGGNPVCVDACLMRCLHFGDIDELQALYGEGVCDLPILPDSSTTNPNTRINPRTAALSTDFEEKEM